MRTPIGRRGFLQGSAGSAALPAGALRLNSAPSDRVRLGLIGLGVRGRDHHLRLLSTNPAVEIGALCDVDRRHADLAAQLLLRSSGKRPPAYSDFRHLLDQKNLDAVIISAPDHWHSIIAIQAMEAGKDVYCEKPLTLFIAEGRAMVNTARQYGTVFQTGSQQRSDWRFRLAVELVQNGRIGTLRKITTHLGNPGTTSGAFINPGTWEPAQTPPEGLDFDMWLGPAPFHEYSPNRCHFEFRYHNDHSGGRITDWGAHHNDIAQWALGMDHSGPIEIAAGGSFNKAGPYDYANYFTIRYRYSSGVELVCENEGGNGVRFEGSSGWIFATRMRLETSHPDILSKTPAAPATLAFDERNKAEEIPGTDAHHNNWLESIRTRKPCAADIETGHRSATVCHLGNIALRLGRSVKWDPEKEEFIGDPAANLLRDKPMRAPWRL